MADASATKDLTKDHVKIEDVGPARKRLTITVPVEIIDTKITESMQTLASETVLPGFRKGHVPSGLLQRRFGGAVKSETKNQIIADAYATAIEEFELKPIGEPEPDEGLEKLEIEEGKPLQFSLEIEVVPDFELPSLEGIEIKRPVIEITDEHLDAEITRLQRELGESSPVEGKLKEEDRLTGSMVVTAKGKDEPVHEQEQVMIIYPAKADEGRGPVLGLMIDDLSDLLKGKKAGDTIAIKTTGPDAHEREDIRGAELTITFDIQEAMRITPATTEKVVEGYGLPSEEILREQIKLALEQRMTEAFTRRDHREGGRAGKQLQRLKAQLHDLYEKWLEESS